MTKKLSLLFFICILSALNINARDYTGSCGTNVRYHLDTSTGVMKITGTGAMTNYHSSVPWYSNKSYIKTVEISDGVTSIGEEAFYDCSGLTSVTIPNSVISIGYMAFESCSGLTSVTIPNSVTSIGSRAFQGCSGLTSITIGNSVTSIGSYAFRYCSSLTKVTLNSNAIASKSYSYSSTLGDIYGSQVKEYILGDDVTSIGSYAFYTCSKLTSITIPNSVTSIGRSAFEGCSGLTSVTIPNSVTSIEYEAFYTCSKLTSITIPNSVTSIGGRAFSSCSGLTSISVESGNKKYDSRNNCNAIIQTASNTLIAGCKNTTIPNSVTSIRYEAFYECSGLTSVIIPNSVTSIGEYAFRGCSGLTQVTLNNNDIASKSYSSSSTIGSIFGSQVNEYVLGDDVTSIGSYAFYGRSGLTSVTIPNSVTSIGSSAFQSCSGLTSVTIPNSVTSIGNYAFQSCSGLTSVTIGNSVTSIGSSAFNGCSGLTSITIPNSVTSIGGRAFSSCSGLTSISVESGNKKYDSRNNCNAIIQTASNTLIAGCKNTTIPNSVTSIGSYAFGWCSGLTSVTIPNSVTSIGDYAFYYCSGLASVKSERSVPFTFGSDAFSYISSNCVLTVPYKTKDAYIAKGWTTSVFKGGIKEMTYVVDGIYYDFNSNTKQATVIAGENKYSGNVTIPSSVTFNDTEYSVKSIGNSAFYGCSGLTSVTIPNSVTSIGSYAFDGCSGLTQVTLNNNDIASKSYSSSSTIGSIFGSQVKEYIIGDDVTSIGSYAFYNCSGLTSITIPNSVTSIGNSAFYGTNLKTLIVGTGMLSFGTNAFSTRPVKTIWLTNTPPQNYTVAQGTVNYVANSQYSSLSNKIEYKFLSSMFEVDGVRYVPVSPSERTCDAIDCVYDMSSTEININSTVTYKGVNLKVQNIKPYSFYENNNLKKINLGFSGSIGKYVCSGCTNLQTAVFGQEVTEIEDYAFQGCSSLNDVQIGQNVISIGQYAFSGCSALPKIQIPQSVTSIANNAFQGCGGLKTVIMDNGDSDLSLSSNGSNPMFTDCPLDSVYIGRNITYITSSSYGYSPFYHNSSLRTVVITDKETDISENEFYGCTNLQNIQIGDGVTAIGNWAFSGCSSLKSLSFGTQLQSIGQEAFSDCTAITSIVSKVTTPPICGSQALDDISKWDCVLYVPEGTISTYQAADQWKEFFFVEEGDPFATLRGDANGDGEVDMDDAMFVTNIILGTEDATEAADVNKDGEINMPDVMFIINYIKNGKFPDE